MKHLARVLLSNLKLHEAKFLQTIRCSLFVIEVHQVDKLLVFLEVNHLLHPWLLPRVADRVGCELSSLEIAEL